MVRPMSRAKGSGTTAAQLIATWFGCGRSPIAPGTVGTLGALPLHFALKRLNPVAYVAITAGITALGVWAAERASKELGEEDPQSVVIDEVAGTLIALSFVQNQSLASQALAVVLFRVFDIAKPGPIDSVQRLKPEGVGIMADDVMAGLLAGVVARVVSVLAGH